MGTSPRPYKNKELKNLSSQNEFLRPKSMTKSSVLEGARKDRLKRWITMFRRNPVRFIQDYFGIHLHPYQILMIWILQRSNLAYIVASRAAAKTWIIAVWTLTLCVLYPGIKVIVCSKTLSQGGILLSEKMKELQNRYPNVAREIDHITTNSNTYECIFHCGSSIKVVPSSDSARGNRCHYIVIEEARLVPREILEKVIKPFLEVRTPPYRLKPEYGSDKDLIEDGRISYITSAWYTAEYWYTYVKSCIRRMVNGDETANFLSLDYFITLFHGIKTVDMIKNETGDMDEIGFQLEYLNIPSGSSGKSFFASSLFKRNLKQAFYPQRDDNFNAKKNPYAIEKLEGEIRFITCDVAMRANKKNDNSIMACIRLIPIKGEGYERHCSYMESHKGEHTGVQAKRIKELYHDFEADYVCLDLQNAGISIFDSLSENTMDEERGETYPPFTVVDENFLSVKDDVREELRRRARGINALPVIFPMSASQDLNSQIANLFRSSLQKKLWKFLILDGDAEEFLIKSKNKEFLSNPADSSIYAFYLNPYVQTGLTISECINLDLALVSGKVKLVEKAGCNKDRYSALSYVNFFISQEFDTALLKEEDTSNDWDIISGLFQMY
jgi:hypothetical protein